ncbi:MAG: hypothetical protein K0S45_4429 [Nitrospira sp.]|jgi:hypothetical protein|nr:hypothetical protein [Nitrospira sp.]MCE3225143.1 hypothetical protein [Nitrospira sp.]
MGDAEESQRRQRQGDHGEPVLSEVRGLVRSEQESHGRIYNKDDPNQRADTFQHPAGAPHRLDDQQSHPHESQQQHRRLEPSLQITQDFSAFPLHGTTL